MPATGYRSVTVHQKYYDDLKSIAHQKGISITELIEKLIKQYSRPYIRATLEMITADKPDFKAPYHAFVLDRENTKYYESTAWVRTEDYAKRMHVPMLLELEDRFYQDDEFTVNKIFILSQNSWSKKAVWEWINQWLAFRSLRKKQLSIFVLKEKIADEIIATLEKDDQKRKRYFDMGIYVEARGKRAPDDTVGYLEIDSRSHPGDYKLIRFHDDAEEVNRAERYFGELKKNAQAIEDILDLAKLQQTPYD